MTKLDIYLTFNGNCEDAFNFYRSVFKTEFQHISRFNEMPPAPGMPPIPDKFANMILHVALPIDPNTLLMGSDTGGDWAPSFKQGNNFSISISTDNKEEADRIFNELSAGGSIVMPLGKTFWSDYYGMLTDKFGINWMMSLV